MTDLAGLLTRVEAATGADRGLFLDIASAVVPDYRNALDWRVDFNSYLGVEAWEQAALALVERVLPGWGWEIGTVRFGRGGYLAEVIHPVGGMNAGERPTPALALLAALLKAFIAQAGASASGSELANAERSPSPGNTQ